MRTVIEKRALYEGEGEVRGFGGENERNEESSFW